MKPQADFKKIDSLARAQWQLTGKGPFPPAYFFAVRGYWPKTMGPTPGNDPGVYDDAIFFATADGSVFRAEQANTDPSRYGWNAGASKPMAVLNTGIWHFRRGAHKNKTPAFRQMTSDEAKLLGAPNNGYFSVTRTYAIGDPRNYQQAGYYAINIHPGGINGTSSEGCQTFPRSVATKVLQLAWDTTKNLNMKIVPYILVDGPI